MIKIGQYLASRPDVMPGPYIDALGPLRDQVPARDFNDIIPSLVQFMALNGANNLSPLTNTP